MDLKSGKNLDPDHDIQVSKYGNMFNRRVESGEFDYWFEQAGIQPMPATGAFLLHVNSGVRTGLVGVTTRNLAPEVIANSILTFDSMLLPLWKGKNANAQPKVFELPSDLTIEKYPEAASETAK